MTNDEYVALMDMLTSQVRVISMLPIEEALEDLDRVESIGFLYVAPLEWSAGLKNVADAKELLNAALTLKRIAQRHQKS